MSIRLPEPAPTADDVPLSVQMDVLIVVTLLAEREARACPGDFERRYRAIALRAAFTTLRGLAELPVVDPEQVAADELVDETIGQLEESRA